LSAWIARWRSVSAADGDAGVFSAEFAGLVLGFGVVCGSAGRATFKIRKTAVALVK
jgi:hypothetical protein